MGMIYSVYNDSDKNKMLLMREGMLQVGSAKPEQHLPNRSVDQRLLIKILKTQLVASTHIWRLETIFKNAIMWSW